MSEKGFKDYLRRPKRSLLHNMIEYRRLAAHAHCRIKTWRLNHVQAVELAQTCSEMTGKSPRQLYDEIIAGEACLFGARCELR